MPLLISILLLAVGLVAVFLDLGVFGRRSRPLSLPAALAWSALWLVLSLAFTGFVFLTYDLELARLGGASVGLLTGQEASLQFFAAWLIEKSIVVANLVVIAVIFSYFRVTLSEQHRMLFWGLLGVVLLRAPALAAGGMLVRQWEGAVYFFGGLLIASAFRVMVARRDTIDPEKNLAVFLIHRWAPPSEEFDAGRLLTRREGRRSSTPLLQALILVLTTNVMFAIDTVPGAFAFTREPFLVFTANLFSLLGLRALFYVVYASLDRIRYLQLSLVVLFIAVGIRLILAPHVPVDNVVALTAAGGILLVGLFASIFLGSGHPPEAISPMIQEIEELVWISYRQARRLVVLLIGTTVMVIGVVMTVTPGPAFVVIPLGIAILAIEFAWARRWLARIRSTFGDVEQRISKRLKARGKTGGDSGGGERRNDDAGREPTPESGSGSKGGTSGHD